MDARNTTFGDGSFGMVIDKGLLDAFDAGTNSDGVGQTIVIDFSKAK